MNNNNINKSLKIAIDTNTNYFDKLFYDMDKLDRASSSVLINHKFDVLYFIETITSGNYYLDKMKHQYFSPPKQIHKLYEWWYKLVEENRKKNNNQ